MAHMSTHVEQFTAYHVDTTAGTEIVPQDVCGMLNHVPADQERQLRDYLEGRITGRIEVKFGFYSRLSASGYLDCTSWDGPYATEEEALAAVCDMYDCDANGDDVLGRMKE